jgi:hypothetical protein
MLPFGPINHRWPAALIVLFAGLLKEQCSAQPYALEGPEFPLLGYGLGRFYEDTLAPEAELPPLAPRAVPRPYLYQIGPVRLRPFAAYQFSYGDGVLRRIGEPVKTGLHAIGAGTVIELSDNWRLDYGAGLRYYTNPGLRDTVSHRAGLSGVFGVQDWIFGISQRFDQTSTTLIELGEQADRTSYVTDISARYPLSSAVSLQLGVNQTFQFSERFNNWRQWSTMNWVNWQLRPRIGVGMGAGFGYADVDFGTDMTYEQVMSRISWSPRDNLSLQLNGGVEIRQFLDVDLPDRVSPVYGATFFYRPFDRTALSLSARRATRTSLFRDSITETTSVSVGLGQVLTDQMTFTLGTGYQWRDFETTIGQLRVWRADDYLFFRPALSYRLTHRARLALHYQYSRNTSSVPGFEFSSNMGGVEARYSF